MTKKGLEIADSRSGICLAPSFHGLIGGVVRTLLNRCGDRELLLALMALVGAIVALVSS